MNLSCNRMTPHIWQQLNVQVGPKRTQVGLKGFSSLRHSGHSIHKNAVKTFLDNTIYQVNLARM